MIDSDAKAIIDALRDALLEARPFVSNRIVPSGHPERDWRAENAENVLERVDGAIAEAEEVLW